MRLDIHGICARFSARMRERRMTMHSVLAELTPSARCDAFRGALEEFGESTVRSTMVANPADRMQDMVATPAYHPCAAARSATPAGGDAAAASSGEADGSRHGPGGASEGPLRRASGRSTRDRGIEAPSEMKGRRRRARATRARVREAMAALRTLEWPSGARDHTMLSVLLEIGERYPARTRALGARLRGPRACGARPD